MFKKGNIRNKKKFNEKKKILYTMEDSEDENTSGDEETYILFMGVETQDQDGESDEEGEVDLKSKLISALEELEKCRKKNSQTKSVVT